VSENIARQIAVAVNERAHRALQSRFRFAAHQQNAVAQNFKLFVNYSVLFHFSIIQIFP
jgi:hypothetical protein